MKLAACLLSALEVPLLFFLGRRLSGDGAAFWAALLGVVAPPAFSRLSFAFLAAIFAHFLDTLVLAAMAARSRENRIPITAVTALLIVSMGSYAGSLINFGLFVPLFGLFLFTVARQRQVAVRLVGGSVLAAAVVLGTIYREFLGVFLSDMAPRFLTSEARAGTWELGCDWAHTGTAVLHVLRLPLSAADLAGRLGILEASTSRLRGELHFRVGGGVLLVDFLPYRNARPLYEGQRNTLGDSPSLSPRRRSSRRGGATSAAMAMGGSALLRWGCPVRRLLLRRRHRGKIPTCAIEARRL